MKQILFNTEMVRAILDGRKTVTRRLIKNLIINIYDVPNGINGPYKRIELTDVIKGEPDEDGAWFDGPLKTFELNDKSILEYCQYVVGDILYVKETWKPIVAWSGSYRGCEIEYKAGGKQKFDEVISLPSSRWKKSRNMPKEAARIFLKVTDVRVERLRDMTLDDFLNEGITVTEQSFNDTDNACLQAKNKFLQAKNEFIKCWNSTVKEESQEFFANPWVWVIEFERCEKPD